VRDAKEVALEVVLAAEPWNKTPAEWQECAATKVIENRDREAKLDALAELERLILHAFRDLRASLKRGAGGTK
jgi:hypothetical protein